MLLRPCIALLALVIAPRCEARDPFNDTVVERPAFNAERVPDHAVDHVLIVEVDPIGGPPGVHRVRQARLGRRLSELRLDLPNDTPNFTDLVTKTYVSYSVDEDGKYRSLGISRPDPGKYYTYQRTKTGERDRVLGEQCDVWATTRVGERDEGYSSVFETCLASDGIELWTRIKSTSRGKVEITHFRRTLSIERRSVPASEMRPPRDLLDPRKWAGMGNAKAAGWTTVSHQVQLTGNSDLEESDSGNSRLLRERNPWTYREGVAMDGARSWVITNRQSGLQITARQYAGGGLHSIGIAKHRGPLPAQKTADLGKSGQLLGERCRWIKPVPDDYHYYEQQCRTADGIVLLHESGNSRYGGHISLKAVSLRRGPFRPADLLPPARMMILRNWGL